MTDTTYLPANRPPPVSMEMGMDQPYWDGLREGKLLIQRCGACQTWIWGPEHLCHNCLTWDPLWEQVEPTGIIHAWTRVFTPGSAVLKAAAPYLTVLVELPAAGGVRMLGNLLGDANQSVKIGEAVTGVFEQHKGIDEAFALLQWRKIG